MKTSQVILRMTSRRCFRLQEKNKKPFEKSYESDGIMGKEKGKTDNKNKKQEDPMFFNTTESSE